MEDGCPHHRSLVPMICSIDEPGQGTSKGVSCQLGVYVCYIAGEAAVMPLRAAC